METRARTFKGNLDWLKKNSKLLMSLFFKQGAQKSISEKSRLLKHIDFNEGS